MNARRKIWSRREFLKRAGGMGALLSLSSGRIFALLKMKTSMVADSASTFQFRSVSIRRIAELKSWMDKLDGTGRLSANKTWRRYIGSFQYGPPPALADARSLIIMATPLRIARIHFHVAGGMKTVLIPCGYVDDGNTLSDLKGMLVDSGVVPLQDPLERARLPLKQLAVRSGLATYGRNNITFIEGYGSFHQLTAFFSRQTLPDYWGPLKMMRLCKGCSICLKECPTSAIRESDFVIDPAKCITLYNELSEPMPDWIPATAHNALVGCLKCQLTCPGNEDQIDEQWDLGEVPEAETAALLSGRINDAAARSLKEQFRRIDGGDDLPYIARNLKLVLAAAAGATDTGS
jgi:epoxyqueuosine reductase